MRKLLSLALLAVVALAGCGGGDDAFSTPGTGGGGTANVASITISSSASTIFADGSNNATLTALVRDANNNLVQGVAVAFSATSGGVAVTRGTTDTGGAATATLSTGGDTTLRNITVTASAGGQNATVVVAVVAPPPPATAATITLVSSTPTLPSDGALTADITAIARNSSNQFVAGVAVNFTTSSGGLNVVQGTTDASGVARATLTTAGDPTNRTITVTAQSGTITQTVNVDVVGSTLTIQGPAALALNQTATYTVTLANSAAIGIPSRTVTLAISNGNTLNRTTFVTDTQGRGTVDVTIAAPGNTVLTATALGLTGTQNITVNADAFAFTAPVANTEVPLNTSQSVTLQWTSSGAAPAAGQTINFTTTRGTVTPSSITTNGTASTFTVNVSSTSAGFGTLAASAGSSTAQWQLEFVATTAASLEVQSSSFTLAPSEQATITAVVRDAANNLVKNKTVTFTLTDTSGGTLSVASAMTDSNGRAQTIYAAGTSTTANNGVSIVATVQGTPAATDTVFLTVARRQVFISIGTGNSISEPNAAQYKIDYIIQVTDSNGNGVSGVALSLSMLSERYLKGFRQSATPSWLTCYTTVNVGAPSTRSPFNCNGNASGGCFDEDTNRNGVLDPGEDNNGSGRIEAGNIATVTPNNATTDTNGFVLVSVFYPQEYAYWLVATIEAKTSVAGTEFARRSTFLLPGIASDFNQAGSSPPGPISPFGESTSCTDTL